jgi:hypothetical protein
MRWGWRRVLGNREGIFHLIMYEEAKVALIG